MSARTIRVANQQCAETHLVHMNAFARTISAATHTMNVQLKEKRNSTVRKIWLVHPMKSASLRASQVSVSAEEATLAMLIGKFAEVSQSLFFLSIKA